MPDRGRSPGEILAWLDGELAKPPDPEKCTKVTHLERVWKEAKEGFTRPLTRKQQGQLKHLAAAVGGFPSAARLVQGTLPRWGEFADAAKTAAGLRRAPAVPSIGFLLAHVEVAMDMTHAPGAFQSSEIKRHRFKR